MKKIIGYDENGPQYALSRKEKFILILIILVGTVVSGVLWFFLLSWILS